MRRSVFLVALALAIAIGGCLNDTPRNETKKEPPEGKPEGFLVKEIPDGDEIVFASARHLLETLECLDEEYELKDNFILDPQCNARIYGPQGDLFTGLQLFTMDLDTGRVTQITNKDCHFSVAQATDRSTLMAAAATSDSNGDGRINDRDTKELYVLNLAVGAMECLTCGSGLEAINNPDYSRKTHLVVFSARRGPNPAVPNHLFTISLGSDLVQLTADDAFGEFDCAWSADGTKIVFSRLPVPFFTEPSQIWIMDTGTNQSQQLTSGGGNPTGEGPHGVYPIGIDADPDLSPDGGRVVFSRLRTGLENQPFGVFELIVLDIRSGDGDIIDSSLANMLPDWGEDGILVIRQRGSTEPMKVEQALNLYDEYGFRPLEEYPYSVFPVGAYSASWIDLEDDNDE